MMSWILLFLSFTIILATEICNYSFICNTNENDNFCAIKKRTDSASIFEIRLKKCSSMPCNVFDNLLGDTEKNTNCQGLSIDNNDKVKSPSYPGGICSSDFNCLSGICINHICVDSQKEEECLKHENCPINTACIEGKCSSYLQYNDDCNDTYQCDFNLFCNKDKKCDKLFQYKDGMDITNKILSEEEKIENLCESGGYIIEEKHIFCKTLNNVNLNCNDECTYVKKSDNKNYISKDNCLCGYNKYRTKHCVLGNGEDIYKDFLAMKKEFMGNKSLTQFCHTLERDFDEICLQLVNTDMSVSFRNYVKEYNHKRILALQHHRLQESESCVKEVIFNYDTNPIFSFEQQCPIFSCDSKKENCFLGNNPLQEDGKNISIILNPYICSEKEYCTLPEENKLINTSLIMNNIKLEGQCKIYQGKKGIKRYPGESCNINSDCIVDNSICKDGQCTGVNEGENCKKTEQCLVGFYCNNSTKKCEKQKKEGEKCIEGWDCENFLGCFKGRCIKFGTLKKGIKITNESAPFPGDDLKHFLCYTGELNEGNGITGDFCVTNDYDVTWKNSNNKNPDENGYIKCNFGEQCIYHNGRNKVYKNCECGYNNMGQGYCPLPSAQNLDNWIKKMEFIADSANNKCHSLSRLNCYLNNNYEHFVNQRYYESITTEAHLFYNSIDCAYKMFVEQRNLKINFYLLILFLIELLF